MEGISQKQNHFLILFYFIFVTPNFCFQPTLQLQFQIPGTLGHLSSGGGNKTKTKKIKEHLTQKNLQVPWPGEKCGGLA